MPVGAHVFACVGACVGVDARVHASGYRGREGACRGVGTCHDSTWVWDCHHTFNGSLGVRLCFMIAYKIVIACFYVTGRVIFVEL